jgi:hypothetical protein
VGGSVLAARRVGAACGACGADGPAGPSGGVRAGSGALVGGCQNVSRIRVARWAMALRATGEVVGTVASMVS